jgi:hypothetical protein
VQSSLGGRRCWRVFAGPLLVTLWPSAMLLVWLGAGGTCLADGGGRLGGGIEPAYSACLSAKPSCKNVARAQFRIQYKQNVTRTFSLRLRVSRVYQLTLDDADYGSSEQQRASNFNPPVDTIDLKLRFSEPDGRDRFEARTGYFYQYATPNTSNGYHTIYASGDYYFGAPIPSGWGRLSRRFDVLMRVSQDLFATANRPAEQLVQLVPTYTAPLNSDGATRAYVSYAREQRFSGSDRVRTPSNRFEVGLTRDPTRRLELYAKLLMFATRSLPGTTKGILGVEYTF